MILFGSFSVCKCHVLLKVVFVYALLCVLRPVVLLVLCATARRVFSWLIRSLRAVVDGREDLMDRGVLEAAELKMAFVRLEDKKGGSITTVQDLLKWNIIDSAIKEGVVSLTSQFRFPLAF